MIAANLLRDWEQESQGYIKMLKKHGSLPEHEAPFDIRILCLIKEVRHQQEQTYLLKNAFQALKEYISDPKGQEILEDCLKSFT